jgi:hypothetical protein
MFHILAPTIFIKPFNKTTLRRRQVLLQLVYKSKKLQRFRRRRFPLTKFVILLTTTLVLYYKIRTSKTKTKKKLRFFRVFKNISFTNIQKKTSRFLKKSNQVLLRHLEINSKIHSFTVLPIPYTYFYSFLLDQTFLWKSVLIELQLYYR